MLELQSFTSKDALKTAKNKCYTTLKNNVLQQYKVAMINYKAYGKYDARQN